MLTSVNIINQQPKNEFTRFLYRLRGDSVTESIVSSGNISVRQLTYTSRSGKVKAQKLYKTLGQNALVLTENSSVLPNGIIRFNSNAFSQRLCVNMALEALKSAEDTADLRLGIYDPEAVAPDFLLKTLRLCRSPVAVTYDPMPYEEIRQRALDELGASAVITRCTSELKNCDFIVAPARIGAYLPIKSTAVVLTAGKPYIKLPGRIYFRYTLNLPENIERLRPKELDAEYFCSGLYTLCSMHNLGSMVPMSCVGNNHSQTVNSLRELISI